ncbi:MAG: hypothetical protein ACFCVF_11260 [Kineosporiaceae bacterium]
MRRLVTSLVVLLLVGVGLSAVTQAATASTTPVPVGDIVATQPMYFSVPATADHDGGFLVNTTGTTDPPLVADGASAFTWTSSQSFTAPQTNTVFMWQHEGLDRYYQSAWMVNTNGSFNTLGSFSSLTTWISMWCTHDMAGAALAQPHFLYAQKWQRPGQRTGSSRMYDREEGCSHYQVRGHWRGRDSRGYEYTNFTTANPLDSSTYDLLVDVALDPSTAVPEVVPLTNVGGTAPLTEQTLRSGQVIATESVSGPLPGDRPAFEIRRTSDPLTHVLAYDATVRVTPNAATLVSQNFAGSTRREHVLTCSNHPFTDGPGVDETDVVDVPDYAISRVDHRFAGEQPITYQRGQQCQPRVYAGVGYQTAGPVVSVTTASITRTATDFVAGTDRRMIPGYLLWMANHPGDGDIADLAPTP